MQATTTTHRTSRASKQKRIENPEKLSIRARRDFKAGHSEIDAIKQLRIKLLFTESARASLAELEQRTKEARQAQATAHFVHSLWDLIIDLEKRIPTEKELEDTASIIRKAYALTPESWNWKEQLKRALNKSGYFASVRDLFPL